MAVLVTGAGLIGCHTARLLVDAGQEVVLPDNRPDAAAIASLLPGGRVPAARVAALAAPALPARAYFIGSGRPPSPPPCRT